MTPFADATELLNDARKRHMPYLLRALFQKHARTYGMRLSEAVGRWLPKLRELYGEAAVTPVQELLDEVEWEWDE
jgi:hypothetical protein